MGVSAQMDGGQHGFGGQQKQVKLECSKVWTDVNYADDGQAYHNMDIYLPDKGKETYPVVVHIYGSAWYSNSSKGMADIGTIVDALIKAGYAVVCPNHRSSQDAKWPAQINDIKAVVRFIRANAKQYNLDPSFIAMSGFSSGAHLSSFMAATNNTEMFRIENTDYDIEGKVGKYTNESSKVVGACVWSGPIDLMHMDCAGERNMPFSPEEAVMGKSLKTELNYFAALSTTTFVDKDDVPMIIFHGTADSVVPFCQGEILHNTLTAAGVRNEFVPVKDGNHGFNGMYEKQNLDKMVSFLDSLPR
ncbi:MAG: alpha/beta hydrolase [Bacteroidaceae bacterium]|nr:alpha/beta hydrolase [Bacteroidaceae bacterium]